jgi:hypothetical protein
MIDEVDDDLIYCRAAGIRRYSYRGLAQDAAAKSALFKLII